MLIGKYGLNILERDSSFELYGKMGHMIEEIALQRGHEIVCKIDVNNPEELRGLDKILADKYFCNFSLFQSLPDSVVSASFQRRRSS